MGVPDIDRLSRQATAPAMPKRASNRISFTGRTLTKARLFPIEQKRLARSASISLVASLAIKSKRAARSLPNLFSDFENREEFLSHMIVLFAKWLTG
jgi:hypothetical protein